jgi:hypothetical protein
MFRSRLKGDIEDAIGFYLENPPRRIVRPNSAWLWAKMKPINAKLQPVVVRQLVAAKLKLEAIAVR